MEIRSQSQAGPVVLPLAEIAATLSRQIDDMKQLLPARLNRDPSSFAQVEVEIHDRFRHLADQMTASLLAEASIPGDRTEPGKKGGPAGATDLDASRRRGG